MARKTTNLYNSYDLRTGSDGLTPQYLVNGVPIGGNRVEISGNTTLTGDEDVVFVDGTATVTFPAATVGYKPITVRNLAGICTLAVSAGAIEFTDVTVGGARTMTPRNSDNTWYQT